MVKVLELIDGGFLGGGQTHILSIAENIDKNNFDLTIAASAAGEFKKTVLEKGYKFADIELPKIFRTKYLKQLEKLAGENNFDIIHSHGGVAGMYARFLKKKHGNFRIIHTIHGIHYINTKNYFRNFLAKTIEQHLVPFTDKFICVSEYDMRTAERIGIIDKEKAVIIKNGINLERFRQKTGNKHPMKKLGLEESNFIIGNISRFDYQKNQRQIIRVAGSAADKNNGVKFLLIGDGKLCDDCKKMAEASGIGDRFIFTGEVKNVEDYYPLMDIFVFPSLWEGLSITLIEALASSKCIIASDIEPNKEIIKNGINGMLFKAADDDSLLNAIQNLIKDPVKRKVLESNAFDSSAEFSAEKMTRKIEMCYSELIRNKYN